MKKKLKTPIWVNFSLLTLLLVSSGATLTACQNVRFGPEAIKKQKEEKAVKAEQKKPDKNQPAKSQQTPGKVLDTQIDDDPE